jgi:hypothetical protein
MPFALSVRHIAEASPARHAFRPGAGYLVSKGGPEVREAKDKGRELGDLVYGPLARGNCNPPGDAKPRSWHNLSANGSLPIAFQWLSGCWCRLDMGSKRLGYPPAYLSSHGWIYRGPARGRHG